MSAPHCDAKRESTSNPRVRKVHVFGQSDDEPRVVGFFDAADTVLDSREQSTYLATAGIPCAKAYLDC